MKKILGLLVATYCLSGLPATGAEARGSGGSHFALSLDGKSVGLVQRVSGGTIRGEVVISDPGTGVVKKHLSGLEHGDLSIEVGMGMSRDFFDWIHASFDKGSAEKSIELQELDFENRLVGSRHFADAQITEVTFPALNASSKDGARSKDAARLGVVIEPAQIRYVTGDASTQKLPEVKGKRWRSSNFRFELGDLPSSRVAKIDSFTWKQSFDRGSMGTTQVATEHATKVEVPNLKITISMADIGPWTDWHKSFVIDGNATDADELSGSITYLGADLETVLGRVDLMNVGILSLEAEATRAKQRGAARFVVELYVEKMAFEVF